ncbi:hypothetical protein ACET3Z_031072 [Daucus carota]
MKILAELWKLSGDPVLVKSNAQIELCVLQIKLTCLILLKCNLHQVFKCFFFGFPPREEVSANHYLAQGFADNDISRGYNNPYSMGGCITKGWHIEMWSNRVCILLLLL